MDHKDSDEVIVSIICPVYNQEPYLRNALDSFLGQETSFKYEIIVHDDASTDGSANIIREYSQKHKNIIPIIQKENQYSNGINATMICIPRAVGKYIIFCEGDDCWTDCKKIQKQVEFLENNTYYSACAHQTECIDMITGERWLYSCFSRKKRISIYDVISKIQIYHSSSLMVRSETYHQFLKDFHNYDCRYVTEDYAFNIFLTMKKKVYYTPEIMSMYRRNSSVDSWSYRFTHGLESQENSIKMWIATAEMLKQADHYSGLKYHRVFEKAICKRVYLIKGEKYEKGFLKDKYMREYFLWFLPIKSKLYVLGTLYFRHLYELYRKIQRK